MTGVTVTRELMVTLPAPPLLMQATPVLQLGMVMKAAMTM
jgi:hypothetical protein